MTLPRAAPAAKNRGSIPLPAPLPCGAPARRARRGQRGRRRTAQCRGASLPNVIHWGWRGAAAPSNPRPGEAPPCLLITPPPSHSPMTEAAYRRSDLFERRRRLMDDWAGYLAGPSRGPDQSVDPPCPQQRSMAFPPGITVEGATPAFEGGGKVAKGLATFPPARGAPAPKNRGSLPPPAPLSCGAPPRRARRGQREAAPHCALPQGTR